MDAFRIIAEDKIKKAIEKGQLDNLPGKGKPLELEDLSSIPEDLRMGYKILKNAGLMSDEKELNKEIINLQDLIQVCKDESEKQRLKKKLDEKMVRLKAYIEKNQLEETPAFHKYKDKIDKKYFS